MKKNKISNPDLLAVLITAALKFIMMDWLNMRGVYILGICVFWAVFVRLKTKSNPSILKEWGFQKANFKQTILSLTPLLIAGILLPVIYGIVNQSIDFSGHIIPVLLLYPLWGIVQQFLMLGIILHNLELYFGPGKRIPIILTVSILFSLIHYPSPLLMIVTFGMEILFSFLFLKWRNLWAIGIAHGVVATFLLYYVFERDLWQELFTIL